MSASYRGVHRGLPEARATAVCYLEQDGILVLIVHGRGRLLVGDGVERMQRSRLYDAHLCILAASVDGVEVVLECCCPHFEHKGHEHIQEHAHAAHPPRNKEEARPIGGGGGNVLVAKNKPVVQDQQRQEHH